MCKRCRGVCVRLSPLLRAQRPATKVGLYKVNSSALYCLLRDSPQSVFLCCVCVYGFTAFMI